MQLEVPLTRRYWSELAKGVERCLSIPFPRDFGVALGMGIDDSRRLFLEQRCAQREMLWQLASQNSHVYLGATHVLFPAVPYNLAALSEVGA